MAFDFPSSPAIGDESNGYVWDGQKWVKEGGGGSAVYVSDTAPDDPEDNSLWWESDSGILYVRYNDGSSTQWVAIAGSGGVSQSYVDAGDANTLKYVVQTLTAPQQTQARTNIGAISAAEVPSSVLRSYLAGLTLSTAGSSATFGIAAGVATDSANAVSMVLAAAITKTTGTWAVGSGFGALDVAGTLPAANWVHVFLIRNPTTSAVDVCVSTALTPAGLPVAAGFTQFRRIGSMKTAASLWVAFSQLGDEFIWTTGVQDINGGATSTTPTLGVLSVPTGVKVWAMIRCGLNIASAAGTINIHSPDEVVAAVGLNISFQTFVANGSNFVAISPVRTNTSGQIRHVASATGSLYVFTYGWIDRRGGYD